MAPGDRLPIRVLFGWGAVLELADCAAGIASEGFAIALGRVGAAFAS
jgi:hypothetical protein